MEWAGGVIMRKRLVALLSTMMICGLTACGTEQAGAEDSSQPEDGSVPFVQVNTAVDEPGDDVADLTFMWWGSAVRGRGRRRLLNFTTAIIRV